MSVVVFKNAMMLDARSSEPREGSLVVENGTIRELHDTTVNVPDARVIDAAGRTLMPGLIDAHVHVKAVSLDFKVLETIPVSYLMGQTHAVMKAMLMRGFTTIRDAAGADRGLADGVDHGLYTGPRMRVCGLALSQTGGHSDLRPPTVMSQAQSNEIINMRQHFGRIADGVDECRRAARDELRKGAHHVKIMAGGGVSSPSDPIENTQYSMDELIAINEEARAWHTYTMAHTYTPASITMAVNAGVRTCEHCNLIDAPTAALMAEKGAYHVPTNITYFALNKHGPEWGFPKISIDKLGMIVDVGLQAVEITKNAGVKIGFGTDLLGPCHRYQADEFGLAAEVLGARGALHASLEVNPEIMRMDNVGRLEPGYLADLILVDGNPLEDIACLQNDGEKIPFVMKEGEIFKNLI